MRNSQRAWCCMLAYAWFGCSDASHGSTRMDPSGETAGVNGSATGQITTPAAPGTTGTVAGSPGAAIGGSGDSPAGASTASDSAVRAARGAGSDAPMAGAGGGSASPAAKDGGGDAAAPMANDGGVPDTDTAPPFEGQGNPWLDAAPKATCGSGDKPETGVQGAGGDVSCNLIVHGTADVAGSVGHAWYGTCGYVNGAANTTVIDVSDSAKPRIVTTLTTAGMQNNWESLKANETRGLLAGYQAYGTVLDVYDVSADCTRPVLKSSFDIKGGTGHAGQFSPDGTFYYTSNWDSTNAAVDLMDPSKPKVVTSDFGGTFAHDPFIGKNGTRGYFPSGNTPGGLGSGSLVIVDLTDIQARVPNAKGRPIKAWNWDDGSVSQYPIAVTYRGRDYVLVSDELGSGNCDDPAKPPYGYVHMFDIGDEMNPVLTSRIRTEAMGPCKDGKLIGDGFFGVGTHYCSVDRLDNPRLLACGSFAAGVRVFDIRNPWRPREIAYFSTGGVPGMPRIRLPEQELWIASGKYYVLKFANGVLDELVNE